MSHFNLLELTAGSSFEAMESRQAESDIIQSLYVDLENKLQVDDIKGFLYQNKVITSNEMEKLRIGPQFSTARDLSRELMRMLSAKGGPCASQLLQALEGYDTLGNHQSAHDELVEKLREALHTRERNDLGIGGGLGCTEQSSGRGQEAEPSGACLHGEKNTLKLIAMMHED